MKFSAPIIFLAFVCSHNIFASSSIDIRTEYEQWNSGINGKTNAILFGFGGSHAVNGKILLGGGLITGTHNTSTNETLKRIDADLAIGYRVHPNVSLFTGYRHIVIDHENNTFSSRSFTDTTHGIGVGASTYERIYPDLTAYGRAGLSGLLSTLNSDVTGKDKGIGISTGFELGLVYQLKNAINIGLSVKQQSYTIDYKNDAPKWQNNYVRLGSSLSWSF